MSNSSMVCYTAISPNKSSRNGNKIKKITPHHMSGNLSIETCGNVFAPSSRQASSNYGIGSDGRVGMYVEEKDRAWTSSSYANDSQAVTIEVANSKLGGDWPISDAAWESLVKLCVDICKRNGIPKLVWTGDSSGTLTMHKMFAATDCPGTYLERRMPELASQVNAILSGGAAAPSTPTTGSSSSNSGSKSIEAVAQEVINGKWGNGDTRKKKLEAAGYSYSAVQAKVNELLGSGNKTPSKPSSSSSGSSDFKGGAYRVNCGTLNVRSAPSLSGSIVAHYSKGQTVNLDNWYKIADGYVWARYTAYSGNVRYVAVGKATGKPEADDYLVKA